MKTGDNQKGIGLNKKEERIRKFRRPRPPDFLEDLRELPGVVGHSLHDIVDLGAKAPS